MHFRTINFGTIKRKGDERLVRDIVLYMLLGIMIDFFHVCILFLLFSRLECILQNSMACFVCLNLQCDSLDCFLVIAEVKDTVTSLNAKKAISKVQCF